MSISYLNANGLVAGNIPAKTACPFLAQCAMRNERCPSESVTKDNDFSCAAARAHSLLTFTDSDLLRKVFQKAKA